MMEIIDSVNGLMENLTVKDSLDSQTKYDTALKLDEFKWLSQLPTTMDVSIKKKVGDTLYPITDEAVEMMTDIKDSFGNEDADLVQDAIDTKVTTLNFLKETIKKYVDAHDLIEDKNITYDDLMKQIARSGTSKLGKENLDTSRPKRDLTTLANCMIKKEKKSPKKK